MSKCPSTIPWSDFLYGLRYIMVSKFASGKLEEKESFSLCTWFKLNDRGSENG